MSEKPIEVNWKFNVEPMSFEWAAFKAGFFFACGLGAYSGLLQLARTIVTWVAS